MNIIDLYSPEEMTQKAKALFIEERSKKRLDGWFIIKRIQRECEETFTGLPRELKAANTLREVARRIPLTISEHSVFAGTQSDSFARSYALINPAFEVESFSGYCDPTAVFNDIEPSDEITREQIEELRVINKRSEYVAALDQTYAKVTQYTGEVVFFIEQVTGHVVPDMKALLSEGVDSVLAKIRDRGLTAADEEVRVNYESMAIAL
jgi:formate C-acetyltransferase